LTEHFGLEKLQMLW